MIWRTEHIRPQPDLYSYAQAEHKDIPSCRESDLLCIIGAGPKGMYALNHLANQVRQQQGSKPFKVLWFNQDKRFACGPNYDLHQPEYLLINYCIGHVQGFHPVYRHLEHQKSFVDWLNTVKTINTDVAPTDFASRALVGHYLQWVAMETIRNLPSNVQVELIPQSVTAISDSDPRIKVETQKQSWYVDSVILATGHCYQNSPLIDLAQIPSAYYLQAPYPISQFKGVPSQARVGIIGMGLTFIDIALALTEGRGGSFINGNYRSSGREPIIYPFSRTSLPIVCRGPQYPAQRPLYVLTKAQFKTWMNRSSKIDFTTEVLPLIEEEVQLAYYAVAFGLTALGKLRDKIKQIPSSRQFTLNTLLHPDLNNEEKILQYIRVNIEEAHKGVEKSPLMAAAAVWGEVSPAIAELYKSVGFTGNSQQQLDQYYFGAFNRISYGPPIVNMEKVYALAKAGIIRFLPFQNPDISWQPGASKFSIQDDRGRSLQVDRIIDARIARPSLQKQNAAFYDILLQYNFIRPHENDGYRPGTLTMNQQGRCSRAGERPIYCYGSNTEGVFFDNDTLSRTKNDTACYWVQETLNEQLENTINNDV